MKRVLKVLLVLLIVVIVFGAGFILTLQLFEYRPDDLTNLEVTYTDVSTDNYLSLDSDIKVLTFNTGYASLSETEDFAMDGGEKGRMDTMAEVEANLTGISSILTRESADIVLLQEVDVDSKRSYEINQLVNYQNVLGTSSVLAYNYRCIFVPFPFDLSQMMGKVNSGIATFSEYYYDDAERVQLPGSFSWPVSLANLKRCLLITRFTIEDSDKELVVINVHLSAYDDGSMRLEETEALLAIMETEYDAGNYVVVGGDFNQTFPDGVLDDSGDTVEYLFTLKDPLSWQAPPLISDGFTDSNFQFGVDSTTATCRLLDKPLDLENDSNNQYYLIDGFIVSANISITSVETLDESFKYSDHNPVVMHITLNS
ncbi:MAG: endonuclease/exonuclease/phosphatase family protein [Tenericutes bacterium]|nr:endonuclease/exonuclease/phosphatase family protein [Mycoplasmatota bacterium]